jgi:hypothetical protein
MLKKFLIILASVMVPFINGCCSENKFKEEQRVMIPNPFVHVDSLDKATQGAGFEFDCPQSAEGYSKKDISYIKNNLIQVVFREGEKSLHLRKARGHEDISGDYNIYNKIDVQQIKAYSVTLKGRDDGFFVAFWSYGSFSFAVTSSSPLRAEFIKSLITEMH